MIWEVSFPNARDGIAGDAMARPVPEGELPSVNYPTPDGYNVISVFVATADGLREDEALPLIVPQAAQQYYREYRAHGNPAWGAGNYGMLALWALTEGRYDDARRIVACLDAQTAHTLWTATDRLNALLSTHLTGK